MFEQVRRKRASRVQILSKARVGREKEVEDELKEYMEPGIPVPNSFPLRMAHDSRFVISCGLRTIFYSILSNQTDTVP